jgi:hypothetical protein
LHNVFFRINLIEFIRKMGLDLTVGQNLRPKVIHFEICGFGFHSFNSAGNNFGKPTLKRCMSVEWDITLSVDNFPGPA